MKIVERQLEMIFSSVRQPSMSRQVEEARAMSAKEEEDVELVRELEVELARELGGALMFDGAALTRRVAR